MPILSTLNQLIFPSRCVSCSQLGSALCYNCLASWKFHNFRNVFSGNPALIVRSSIAYSEVAARVILAAKESRVKSADLLIADALTFSLQQWLRVEKIDSLVPIPSRKSAARVRGRQFIDDMAVIVGKRSHIAVRCPLRHQRTVRDQSRLNPNQRWNNLSGALVVSDNPQGFGRVLLVDDLVTTGATLLEAARAMEHAGIEVIGAVTAAVAQTVR